MIEALTRTLWGVRRAAADGVPTEQRLEAARMTMSDTETMTDRANREAIAAGEAALAKLNALRSAANFWSVADDAAAAIWLLISALTAMQGRR